MRTHRFLFWLILTLLAGILSFSGCNCNGKNDHPSPTPQPAGPTTPTTPTTPTNPVYQVYGLNFSPYKDGQDPNYGSVASDAQIRERLKIIAPYSQWIRTFGSSNGLEQAGRIAREFNLKTAIGAWLGREGVANERELANLIAAAKSGYVDLAIVGSEVLLRGDLTLNQLLDYINRFRQAVPNVPVTTGEVYGNWLANQQLIDACDIVFVNYYPYWEGKNVQQAVANVHALHLQVKAKAGGKEVIVSETGWPSAGDTIGQAVPSPDNACFYFKNFVSWARQENVKYFYFEAFDEAWKAAYEGPQGAHWGIWDKDGIMKGCMQAVFNGETMVNNWSCRDLVGGPGTPTLEFTYVPLIGSFDNLQGQVWHVLTPDYAVAVYIKVGGGWWTKPFWNQPKTLINCDGTWVCDITTGGIDEQATQVAAYVIPMTYEPPLASGDLSLPAVLDQNAAAKLIVTR